MFVESPRLASPYLVKLISKDSHRYSLSLLLMNPIFLINLRSQNVMTYYIVRTSPCVDIFIHSLFHSVGTRSEGV